ncbi:MAG: branched-chain amino acid ABC transporter permease [Candidatus Rokubacteria bacterium]|nr:branched-chain amino acid ABC transporter permease [Candidatus Rokubacteria bacterium]
MAHWLLLQLLINGIVAGSLYALLAISFATIYAPTKTFHFAHASIYVYSGYFLYQFAMGWGWPLPVSILGGVVTAGAMGVLVDRVVYTPLRRSGAGVMEVLLSSFAVFVVLQSVLLLVWKSDPRTIRVPEVLKNGIPFGVLTVTPLDLLTVATAGAVLAAVAVFMRYTRLGKAIRAIENDAGMAVMVGIPTEGVRMATFFLGSALVAVAAVFTALDKGLEPTIGVQALLVAVVAMIVGGVGSFPGAALAGLLLGVVENLGIWKIPSEWKSTITFSVLALFLLFRPSGFFGQRVARYSE